MLRLKKKPPIMVLDGIAVALAGLLFLELHFATEPPDARAQRSALIAPQTQLLDGTDFSAPEPTVSIWRNMMLSRPLFDPNRRPPAPPQDPAATVEIPRLSGIMITPTERIAVFSPAMGAPIIVNQNSRFGPFTVLAISGDSVAIKGPSGVIVLRSDFGAGEGPGSSTAKSTLVAAGISLNLVRIALPNATSWPAPPPGH